MSGSAEAANSTTDDEGEAGGPPVGEDMGSAVGPGRATGEGGVRACTKQ